jgi:phosphate starvation-inducible PhoH-like protein
MKEANRERKSEIKEINAIQLNEEQKLASKYIYENPITIITGRPGSGKSLCAAHCALHFLAKKMADNIVLFRPTVEVGKTLGFMPGDLTSKLSPYFEAFIENLEACSINKTKIKEYLEKDIIKEQALQFVRGKTFSNFVIVDEAQNSTQKEMEALVTRLGKTGKIVLLGDLQQKDITSQNDGLSWVINLSNHFDEIKRIDLKGNHRHDLVQKILDFTYKK